MVLYVQHDQILSIGSGILIEHSVRPAYGGRSIHGFPFPFGLGNAIVGTAIQVVRSIIEHAGVRTIGEARHWFSVEIQGSGGGGEVFEGKGVLSWFFIEFRYIFQIKTAPGNSSLIIGEEGFIMCYFPSTARITCIGGTGFHFGRINGYFNAGPSNKVVPFGHGKQLVLLINILGHIIHPSGPASHIPVNKGSLVIVLLYKALELGLVVVQSPPDIVNVLIDGAHQYFGQILVIVEISNFLIIKVHIESHSAVSPLRLPKYVLELFKGQRGHFNVFEGGVGLTVGKEPITATYFGRSRIIDQQVVVQPNFGPVAFDL